MNTKDELIKILVSNAQSWNKEETQDRAFIYVDDFLNEVESKFKLLPIPDVVGRSEQLNTAWKALEWVGFERNNEFTDDDIARMLGI